MAAASTYFDLPWNGDPQAQERFRRITLIALLVSFLLGVIVPLIPLPEVVNERPMPPPPRLAKLIIEQPPISAPQEAITRAPEKPQPQPAPKVPAKKPVPTPKPKSEPKRPDKAIEDAGVLALKDELAALRDLSVDTDKLKTGRLTEGKQQSRAPSRSIISSEAQRGSGGIQTSAISEEVGGGKLQGISAAKVSSDLATGQAGRSGSRGGSGRKSGRTIEEIQLVFDRNKSSIYSLYNRALRQDPTLQGKVVLELTIAPSGRVTKIRVVSAEVGSPALAEDVAARVKTFDFGAKEVDVTVITYPIDFLPS